LLLLELHRASAAAESGAGAAPASASTPAALGQDLGRAQT
jgi:hypothetical protein